MLGLCLITRRLLGNQQPCFACHIEFQLHLFESKTICRSYVGCFMVTHLLLKNDGLSAAHHQILANMKLIGKE